MITFFAFGHNIPLMAPMILITVLIGGFVTNLLGKQKPQYGVLPTASFLFFLILTWLEIVFL